MKQKFTLISFFFFCVCPPHVHHFFFMIDLDLVFFFFIVTKQNYTFVKFDPSLNKSDHRELSVVLNSSLNSACSLHGAIIYLITLYAHENKDKLMIIGMLMIKKI